MKNEKLLDLYSDYLISAFGQTTTGLPALLRGEISHDAVQRFLSGKRQTSVDLWRIAKPHVRKIESEDGVLIVDDSISERAVGSAAENIFHTEDPRSNGACILQIKVK